MSITKALRNKRNYSIFPRGVYMFVGDILRIVPWEEGSSIGEVFSGIRFEIDSFNIDSPI